MGNVCRRSLHATVSIPLQPPAAPTIPPPPPIAQAVPTSIVQAVTPPPKRLSPSPTIHQTPEVQVDIVPNHITVHTHPAHSSPPRHTPTAQPTAPIQTIVETFAPEQPHTHVPLQAPLATARTDVTLIPSRSTALLASVGPEAPAQRRHTHRFPHSATSNSRATVPPGRASEVVDGLKGRGGGGTVPQRFTDIRPVPISEFSRFDVSVLV